MLSFLEEGEGKLRAFNSKDREVFSYRTNLSTKQTLHRYKSRDLSVNYF